MAQQVLGGIGAVIGGIYGGPQGAQYGWMIGSAIGGAIDPQVIQGPRIGEIAQQTAQEGVPRPIIFGMSPPIAGNIIDKGDPVIVRRKESQGKGGPKVETESVFRTYAIRVCEGPIGGFVRVWRNGILVYDVREDSLLTTEENSLFLEKARFFLGSFEQEPSPDLESLFGVGTTPAHQGTAYMVMADEDLTDLRGAIPQYMFQVGRGFGGCELDAEKLTDVDPWTGPSSGDSNRSSVELVGDRIFEQTFSYESGNINLTLSDGEFTRWVREWDLEGNQISSVSSLHESIAGTPAQAIQVQNSSTLGAIRSAATPAVWLISGAIGAAITPPEGDDTFHVMGSNLPAVSSMHLVDDVAVYVAHGRNAGPAVKWISKYPIVNGAPASESSTHILIQTLGVNGGPAGVIGHDSAGRVYAYRAGTLNGESTGLKNILRIDGGLSEIIDTWVLPDHGGASPYATDSFRVFCGRFLVAGRGNQTALIYDLDDDLTLLATINTGVTGGQGSPRFVGGSMLYFREAQQLWRITSGGSGGYTYPLAEVVRELCLRAGLEQHMFDVSQL